MTDPEKYEIRYALIYGLSANPVHQGHIDVLSGAVTNLHKLNYVLGKILIIPVYRRNPIGNQKDVLPETYQHRVDMCKLVAQEVGEANGNVPVEVSRVEAHLARNHKNPNYTASTLTFLKNGDLSNLEIIFLISSEILSGADPEFKHWYKTATILKTAALAVCPRPGFPLNMSYIKTLIQNGGRIILLEDVKTPDISSTTLRMRLENGESPLLLSQEGLFPLSVARYIYEHNLYKAGQKNHIKSQFLHK